MPQTCALLSGTLSVQSVELRCSFLLTETEINNIWRRPPVLSLLMCRETQDILKLIQNINFGLISSMKHKMFASSAYSVYKSARPGQVQAFAFSNRLKNSQEWWSWSVVGVPL